MTLASRILDEEVLVERLTDKIIEPPTCTSDMLANEACQKLIDEHKELLEWLKELAEFRFKEKYKQEAQNEILRK